MRLLAAATALAVGLLLIACTPEEDGAHTPGDGHESPPRIVALSPAIAETVRRLDLGDRLVARHAYDAWSDPALPTAGDQSGLDYEVLLSVHPTHVLIEWGEREPPARLLELAEQNDWTVRSFRLLTFDDILELRAQVAHLFGVETPAPPPAPSPIADADAFGRVLPLISASPAAALGPGSWHATLLERLGLTPIPAEGGAYQTLDAEDVLSLAPDTIVLFAPASPGEAPDPRRLSAGELDAALGPLARLEIPAVRDGRVYLVDHPMALVPSDSLFDVEASLADLLVHPTAREGE